MYVKFRNFPAGTPSKKRARYENFSKCQIEQLITSFDAKVYPKKEELCQIAKSLNTSQRRIHTWFGHMRRRKIAEGMLIESK